jgi:hypothetical protein
MAAPGGLSLTTLPLQAVDGKLIVSVETQAATAAPAPAASASCNRASEPTPTQENQPCKV